MSEIALKINNLKKTYANGVDALKGISFNVEQGEFFALLGPNGAGKSTTIGIITSLVTKTAGQITVSGYDLDTQPLEAKSALGLVPQEFNFNAFEKVEQILIQQAGYYGVPAKIAKARSDTYLKQLDLFEKRDTPAGQLSGGMKRRLMIARALIHQPKILILDEPTAGVDIEIRRSLWTFIKNINEQGTTVILTTHYLEEAEQLCKKIAIIDQGMLIENTTMKSCLQKIDTETFVFYLQDPVTELPSSWDFPHRLVDETTIEIDLHKGQNLNDFFKHFEKNHLIIASMRNKTNRLEELFMKLIRKKS